MLSPRTSAPRPRGTLRATSVTAIVTFVSMIVALGGVAFGVTQYQRSMFDETIGEVQQTSGVMGALDRSVIIAGGRMLGALYRPNQGADFEELMAAYVVASDRVDGAFDRAERAFHEPRASAKLVEARATWESIDEAVRTSPETYTDEELFALMAVSDDPFVETVWLPFDRLDSQLTQARLAVVDAVEARTDQVDELQRLFGPLVGGAIVLAIGVALLTARRLSRRVLSPLRAVGASARTMHDPETYEPCEVPGAVAEVQELARVVHEAAESLHHHHQRLRRQALTDSMTELPNRDAFTEALSALLDDPERSQVAVLFIDLDDFKHVNDTLGHAAGDELLRVVAARLQSTTRDCEIVARLGGDEFAVALRVEPDSVAPTAVAERIRAALAEPIQLEGQVVTAACSIGVVTSDAADDGRDSDSLLGNADFAMYMAKSQGKGRYEVYSAGLHTEMGARMDLIRELGEAVAEDQFVLHFQPMFDLPSHDLLGFEALIRWLHPARGLVPPMEFIPLAEDSGAIIEIGAWVLDRACAELASHHELDPSLSMSVNVSPRQLVDPEFVPTVLGALALHGIAPERLILEVTEATAMTSTEVAAEALARLRREGVHVALDDFGSGFSSLSYLGDLPADVIKIDRSFVDSTSPHSDMTLASIIELAQRLGLHVVAEGVETEADLARLRRFDRIAGQGFLLARPMPAEDALDCVRDRQRSAAAEV